VEAGNPSIRVAVLRQSSTGTGNQVHTAAEPRGKKEPSELYRKLAESFFLEFAFDFRGKPELVERANFPRSLFAAVRAAGFGRESLQHDSDYSSDFFGSR
jgi:hypothetical protein